MKAGLFTLIFIPQVVFLFAQDLRHASEYSPENLRSIDTGIRHTINKLEYDQRRLDSVVVFDNSYIDGPANIVKSEFSDSATFKTTIFNGQACFNGSQFASVASFEKAIFLNTAEFKGAGYHDLATFNYGVIYGCANFSLARFYGGVEFDSVSFYRETNFDRTQFQILANFNDSRFCGPATFRSAQFNNWTVFQNADFLSKVDFRHTKFKGWALFHCSNFENRAMFWDTKFDSVATFSFARFQNGADFGHAEFKNGANFLLTTFDSLVSFNRAQFDETTGFINAKVLDTLSFVNAKSKNGVVLDFAFATIYSPILIGNSPMHNSVNSDIASFDFSFTHFKKKGNHLVRDTIYDCNRSDLIEKVIGPIPIQTDGGKIVLCGPAKIRLSHEQFAYLALHDGLAYLTKKYIIQFLKDSSYSEEKHARERFELDYLFERSTMNQRVGTEFGWEDPFTRFRRWLYDITLGIGYRPFRLLYWIGFTILAFAIFYYRAYPDSVSMFLAKEPGKTLHESPGDANSAKVESYQVFSIDTLTSPLFRMPDRDKFQQFIDCLYFSSMLFFSIRLKRDVLICFSRAQIRTIAAEYVVGLLAYAYFLYFAKSGSILHTLRSLIGA